jgi:hypothetical protein
VPAYAYGICKSFIGSGGAWFARDHAWKQDNNCTRTHAHTHGPMRSGLLQPQQDWTPACYLPSHEKEDEDAEAARRLRSLMTRSIDRTRTHAFARMLAQMINLARVCAELGAIFASLPSPRDQMHAVC